MCCEISCRLLQRKYTDPRQPPKGGMRTSVFTLFIADLRDDVAQFQATKTQKEKPTWLLLIRKPFNGLDAKKLWRSSKAGKRGTSRCCSKNFPNMMRLGERLRFFLPRPRRCVSRLSRLKQHEKSRA